MDEISTDGDRSFIPMDDPVRLRYQVQPFPAEARSALNFAIETYGFQMDLGTWGTWGGGLKATHGDRLKDVGQAIVETPNLEATLKIGEPHVSNVCMALQIYIVLGF